MGKKLYLHLFFQLLLDLRNCSESELKNVTKTQTKIQNRNVFSYTALKRTRLLRSITQRMMIREQQQTVFGRPHKTIKAIFRHARYSSFSLNFLVSKLNIIYPARYQLKQLKFGMGLNCRRIRYIQVEKTSSQKSNAS